MSFDIVFLFSILSLAATRHNCCEYAWYTKQHGIYNVNKSQVSVPIYDIQNLSGK